MNRPQDHLGLVCSITMKYAPKHIPLMDTEEYAEGVLGLFDACKTYRSEQGAFSTYAAKCIKNRVLEFHKKNTRTKRTCIFSDNEQDFSNATAAIPRREIAVDDILGRISSERERKILQEHYIDGKSYQEIGNEISLTKERVKQLTHKAIGFLHDEFEKGNLPDLEFCSFS